MSTVFVVLSLLIMAGLGVGFALFATRAGEATRKLEEARSHVESLLQRLGVCETEKRALSQKLDEARSEDSKKGGWLDHQQEEINWLRGELEQRPKITRKVYKILTLGVKGTGKTSLTLKWSNPLIDLGTLKGTKIERYERTVSHVTHKDVTTEHVFEVHDWGGEHLVDAQHELIMDEIHAMLLVVDLGGRDAKAVDPARIQEQLVAFQPEVLRYFFGPKTVASCKTVVLFINKSDLLSGTPGEVEVQAMNLYRKLIEDLLRYNAQIDIRVFVGSASYGHSTHHLFAHFVEKILPKSAYDNQLLQRMKHEPTATAPLPPPRAPGASPQLPSASNGVHIPTVGKA